MAFFSENVALKTLKCGVLPGVDVCCWRQFIDLRRRPHPPCVGAVPPPLQHLRPDLCRRPVGERYFTNATTCTTPVT